MKKLLLSVIVALLSLVSVIAALPGFTVISPNGGETVTAGSEIRFQFNSQYSGRLVGEFSSTVPGNSTTVLRPCQNGENEDCENYWLGVDSPTGSSSYYGRVPSGLRPGKYRVNMGVISEAGNLLASDTSDFEITVVAELAQFTVFGKGPDNLLVWRVGSTQTVSFATYGLAHDYAYLSLYTEGTENGYNLSGFYLENNGFQTTTFVVRPWIQSGRYVVIGTGQSSFSGSYFAGDSSLYVKIISSVITPAEDQVVVAGKVIKATWLGKQASKDKYGVTLQGSKLSGPIFLNVVSPVRGWANLRIPKEVPPADDYRLVFSSASLQSFTSDRFAIVKKKHDPVTHVTPNNGGGGIGVGMTMVSGKN